MTTQVRILILFLYVISCSFYITNSVSFVVLCNHHYQTFNSSNICHLFAFIQTSRIISVEYRKALHKALAFDLTRPYFRRGNAMKFGKQLNEMLINPHEAILQKSTHLYIQICHFIKQYCIK